MGGSSGAGRARAPCSMGDVGLARQEHAGGEAGGCRGWRETARWWLELERLHHAGHPKRAASAAPATATVRAGISLCWPLRHIRRADAPQARQAPRDRVTPSDSGCNPSRLGASVSMSRASPKGLTHKSVPAESAPTPALSTSRPRPSLALIHPPAESTRDPRPTAPSPPSDSADTYTHVPPPPALPPGSPLPFPWAWPAAATAGRPLGDTEACQSKPPPAKRAPPKQQRPHAASRFLSLPAVHLYCLGLAGGGSGGCRRRVRCSRVSGNSLLCTPSRANRMSAWAGAGVGLPPATGASSQALPHRAAAGRAAHVAYPYRPRPNRRPCRPVLWIRHFSRLPHRACEGRAVSTSLKAHFALHLSPQERQSAVYRTVSKKKKILRK